MGLRALNPLIVVVITLAILTSVGLFYVIYVNEQYTVKSGRGVAAYAVVSFSRQYNQFTDVVLSNGTLHTCPGMERR